MEKTIKKECIYVYNWVILLYSRVWHSIVNRLDFSKRYINTHTQKTLSFYYLMLLWVRNREAQWGPAGFFAYSLPRLVWGCAVGHVCFLGMDPLPGSLWLRAEFGFLQSWDRGSPFLADCRPGAGPCCQNPCCIPSCAFCFACVSSSPPSAATHDVPLIL